jgi:hypothetical protein
MDFIWNELSLAVTMRRVSSYVLYVMDLIARNYKWLGHDSSQPEESRVKTHLSPLLVGGNIDEEKEDHGKVIQEAFL